MKVDEIKLVYEYNYWAIWRILTTCDKVSPDQYVVPTSYGGYASLRATLVHTLSSEWTWRIAFREYFVALDTLNESVPASELKLWKIEEITEDDLPTLDALKERWQVQEREMRSYLDNLSDQDLNGLVRYLIPE